MLPGVHAEPDSHILTFIEQAHVKNPSSSGNETAVSSQCVMAMELMGKCCGVIFGQPGKAALNHMLYIINENSALPHCITFHHYK